MTGSVIRRLATSIDDDGQIHHDDHPAPWAEAEALAGRRLDRRRRFAIIASHGDAPQLCEIAKGSIACSGCSETPEMTASPWRGMRCRECGYTGRRRHSQWVPWLPPSTDRPKPARSFHVA